MKSVIVFTLLTVLAMSNTANSQDTLPPIKSLWDYNDPTATEIKFREALAKAIDLNDSSYAGQVITQIARTYSLRSKFDEAHKTLNELKSWKLDDFPIVYVRYFLELGRTYNSAGDKKQAKIEFQKAWYLATKSQLDFYAVDAAHMQAIAYTELDDQINWTTSAIYIAENSTDQDARNWLGPLYNNMGWNYFGQAMYDEAMEFFQKGLDFRLINNGNAEGIFIAKWCVARTHRALGHNKKALEIQQQLEAEIISKGLNPDGYVYEELAELYWDMGKKDLAKPYYQLAYNILSKIGWLVESEPERIAKLKERAGLN